LKEKETVGFVSTGTYTMYNCTLDVSIN